MADAGDNPTDTFLRYLVDSGPRPEVVEQHVSAAPTHDADDPVTLTIENRTEVVLELFAELVDACRQADLARSERLVGVIEHYCSDVGSEANELARSLVSQTRGDYRLAEQFASACLRKRHALPELTRPIALVVRATQRMRLGLLDAALNDLEEADEYGPSLLSLQAAAVESMVHWWRGDQGQALDALEEGPQFLINGVDLGVGWFALAAELVKNGQIFDEELDLHNDCLAREFWNARSDHISSSYVATLGPHIMRHHLATGGDPSELLPEFDIGASAETRAGKAYQWCVALAEKDSQQLAEMADAHRDNGSILAAIQAYRDAAACAPSDDNRKRLLRRGRFLYDRLSRAVKVSVNYDLPAAIARELNEAEQNVVSAVALGLSNKDAAEELQCSTRTVESHLNSAYKKLGVKRRTQLAVLIAQANVNAL